MALRTCQAKRCAEVTGEDGQGLPAASTGPSPPEFRALTKLPGADAGLSGLMATPNATGWGSAKRRMFWYFHTKKQNSAPPAQAYLSPHDLFGHVSGRSIYTRCLHHLTSRSLNTASDPRPAALSHTPGTPLGLHPGARVPLGGDLPSLQAPHQPPSLNTSCCETFPALTPPSAHCWFSLPGGSQDPPPPLCLLPSLPGQMHTHTRGEETTSEMVSFMVNSARLWFPGKQPTLLWTRPRRSCCRCG